MESKDQTSIERTLQLTILYYVLTLSERRSRLYEGIRDTLVDIQNNGSPFEATPCRREHYKLLRKLKRLGEFLHETDQQFASYFAQDPLKMVLIGEQKLLSIFMSTTVHHHVLMSDVGGDYSSSDLGKIVWSVVKQGLTGENDRLRDTQQKAAESKMIVLGFDTVGRAVQSVDVSTLAVEDHYHDQESVSETGGALMFSPHVEVSELIDDAVDLIVETVLARDPNAVLLKSDKRTKFEKVALIVRDAQLKGSGVPQYDC